MAVGPDLGLRGPMRAAATACAAGAQERGWLGALAPVRGRYSDGGRLPWGASSSKPMVVGSGTGGDAHLFLDGETGGALSFLLWRLKSAPFLIFVLLVELAS